MRRRGLVVRAAVVAAGGAVAARAVERRWTAADSELDPSEFVLPAGESLFVETDDGAKLAVTLAGPSDGPAVVLAHCWMGAREIWAPVAHRLVRDGHRVVLYDQRGHGSSSVGSDGFTIPRLGADLRCVAEFADVSDAVFAGHSMGGMTVMSLASHHGAVLRERGRAVVLVSTGAAGLGRGGRSDLVGQRVFEGRLLERAMRGRFGPALVRSAMGRSVRRSHLVLTRDLVVACPPASRVGWLAAIQGMDLRKGIRSIGVPTTVMVGTWDTLTPVRYAAELCEHIPEASLVKLAGHGHMLPLEAPDDVASAIAGAAAGAV